MVIRKLVGLELILVMCFGLASCRSGAPSAGGSSCESIRVWFEPVTAAIGRKSEYSLTASFSLRDDGGTQRSTFWGREGVDYRVDRVNDQFDVATIAGATRGVRVTEGSSSWESIPVDPSGVPLGEALDKACARGGLVVRQADQDVLQLESKSEEDNWLEVRFERGNEESLTVRDELATAAASCLDSTGTAQSACSSPLPVSLLSS
jgi:hypothetical protein